LMGGQSISMVSRMVEEVSRVPPMLLSPP